MAKRTGRWIKGIARYGRKVGMIILGGIAGLLLLGAAYQQLGQAMDHHAVPAPGRLVAVNGSPMHLHCMGQGKPTILLEAGALGFAQMWAWVQPRVAERARVCSYDRAGMGWSSGAGIHDGIAIADRLQALLSTAGEEGPYLLVGYSMGGMFIRVFAERYPDTVIALMFVDPNHPDQLDRFPPEARAAQNRSARVLSIASRFSYVGVTRLTNIAGRMFSGLPEDAYRTAHMFTSSPRHLHSAAMELAAWAVTADAVRANRTLGDRQVVVISATEPISGMSREILNLGHQMHAEIAALSSRGRRVFLDGSNHFSIITEQRNAERVAQILGRMLNEGLPLSHRPMQ